MCKMLRKYPFAQLASPHLLNTPLIPQKFPGQSYHWKMGVGIVIGDFYQSLDFFLCHKIQETQTALSISW